MHVSLMQEGSRYVVHLVNISDAKFDLSKSFMTDMIPVHEVKVTLEVNAGKVSLIPDGTPLAFRPTEAGIEFMVPVVHAYQAILVEPLRDEAVEEGSGYESV